MSKRNAAGSAAAHAASKKNSAVELTAGDEERARQALQVAIKPVTDPANARGERHSANNSTPLCSNLICLPRRSNHKAQASGTRRISQASLQIFVTVCWLRASDGKMSSSPCRSETQTQMFLRAALQACFDMIPDLSCRLFLWGR